MTTGKTQLKKGERRRLEILRAAGDLFRSKGYRGTTMLDITERVNCSKGSVYHHFASKLQILESLLEDLSEQAYQSYMAQDIPDSLEKLDRLLYFSFPIRKGEESLIAARLSLMMVEEGAVLSQRLRDIERRLFRDELKRLLIELRRMGIASFGEPALPELIWESHSAFGEAMMLEGLRLLKSGFTPASRVAQMLSAQRFLWERLLDLPFDSLTIMPLAELDQVLTRACELADVQETQLRFD